MNGISRETGYGRGPEGRGRRGRKPREWCSQGSPEGPRPGGTREGVPMGEGVPAGQTKKRQAAARAKTRRASPSLPTRGLRRSARHLLTRTSTRACTSRWRRWPSGMASRLRAPPSAPERAPTRPRRKAGHVELRGRGRPDREGHQETLGARDKPQLLGVSLSSATRTFAYPSCARSHCGLGSGVQ